MLYIAQFPWWKFKKIDEEEPHDREDDNDDRHRLLTLYV